MGILTEEIRDKLVMRLISMGVMAIVLESGLPGNLAIGGPEGPRSGWNDFFAIRPDHPTRCSKRPSFVAWLRSTPHPLDIVGDWNSKEMLTYSAWLS
jgi:hypothetical protein